MPDGVPFEVESVLDIHGTTFVFARSLVPGRNWTLSQRSRLGGRPVLPETQIPRALDASGQQRYNLFVFALRAAEDRDHFRVGDQVYLEG